MYHFVFNFRTAGIPGNPVSLQGVSLDEAFNPKALDKADSAPAWHNPVFSVRYPPEEALAFPDELWLNTGERPLDFDFRRDMHGYIVSDRFIEACGDAFSQAFKTAKLHIVNRKGTNLAARPMFYAKPWRAVAVLEDAKRDLYEAEVQTTLIPIQMLLAHALTLRTDLDGDLIFAQDLQDSLLVSDALATRLKAVDLKGLELTAPEDAVARYNDRAHIRDVDGNPVSAFG